MNRNGVGRYALLYARVALGAAFLSAVASRLGVWAWQFDGSRFAAFVAYTADVNAFLPAAIAPVLAWMATVAELSLGLALIVGFRVRWAAWGSALLLAVFGTAMAISFGIKEPLDYSVFSASAGASLLAILSESLGPVKRAVSRKGAHRPPHAANVRETNS